MTCLPILVLNSGSSSIKFSLYETEGARREKLLEGAADGIGSGKPGQAAQGKFWIKDATGAKLRDETPGLPNPDAAFALIRQALTQAPFVPPAAIGHRMVSGGPTILDNQRITPQLVDEMESYAEFAPLHTPIAVYIMRQVMALFPGAPNFVCLDTWFHRTLPQVAYSLPIPAEYAAMGVRRYGFHGLSYESIVAALAPAVPQRLIVAHLGNGASISAIRNGHSIDTSMGLTPTGGIVSGSRTGDIDPGVLLFALRKIAQSTPDTHDAADRLEVFANKKSGLLGVSGRSNDMRALREAIAAGDAKARLAVDVFCYAIRKFIGAYAAVLGGLDMLVFTGGIGENDPATRAEICSGLEHLGIQIDSKRNATRGQSLLSPDGAPIAVRVIPPAEDLMIVDHVLRLKSS